MMLINFHIKNNIFRISDLFSYLINEEEKYEFKSGSEKNEFSDSSL